MQRRRASRRDGVAKDAFAAPVVRRYPSHDAKKSDALLHLEKNEQDLLEPVGENRVRNGAGFHRADVAADAAARAKIATLFNWIELAPYRCRHVEQSAACRRQKCVGKPAVIGE